jgi:hypothetical protein
MRSTLFWNVTQRRFVVSYRRFRTTYLSHLQGSSSPVTSYQSTPLHIQEERRSHWHRGGSLKSRKAIRHSISLTLNHPCFFKLNYLEIVTLYMINKNCLVLASWPCHRSGSWSPTSRSRGQGSVAMHSVWNLWWTKWHWDRFLSRYFGFPVLLSSH